MIGDKRAKSKVRSAAYRKRVGSNLAESLLKFGLASRIAGPQEGVDEDLPPMQMRYGIVYLPDEKGGSLYLIEDGVSKVVTRKSEIAEVLRRYILHSRHEPVAESASNKGRAAVSDDYRSDGALDKGQLAETRPVDFNAFRSRLNDVISSSEVRRKAPGLGDFVRGLREVVQD